MNHGLSAFAHAFLAMIGTSSSVDKALASDFELALRCQPGLKTLLPQELDRRRADSSVTTLHRLALLRRKTLNSAAFVLAAAVIGALVVFTTATIALSVPAVLAIASIICFSWATLGRLGWEGQSYGGQTIFEELDSLIFWSLYGAGTLLGTMAVCIGPAA